jgi:hypothetical protein
LVLDAPGYRIAVTLRENGAFDFGVIIGRTTTLAARATGLPAATALRCLLFHRMNRFQPDRGFTHGERVADDPGDGKQRLAEAVHDLFLFNAIISNHSDVKKQPIGSPYHQFNRRDA